MIAKDYFELCEDIHKRRMVVHKKKAHDYAGEDVLSNFKRLSLAAKSLSVDVKKPEGYALFMAIMKIDRIINLNNKGVSPENESLDDTFVDVHNYVDLARAIIVEGSSE